MDHCWDPNVIKGTNESEGVEVGELEGGRLDVGLKPWSKWLSQKCIC